MTRPIWELVQLQEKLHSKTVIDVPSSLGSIARSTKRLAVFIGQRRAIAQGYDVIHFGLQTWAKSPTATKALVVLLAQNAAPLYRSQCRGRLALSSAAPVSSDAVFDPPLFGPLGSCATPQLFAGLVSCTMRRIANGVSHQFANTVLAMFALFCAIGCAFTIPTHLLFSLASLFFCAISQIGVVARVVIRTPMRPITIVPCRTAMRIATRFTRFSISIFSVAALGKIGQGFRLSTVDAELVWYTHGTGLLNRSVMPASVSSTARALLCQNYSIGML